MLYAASLTYHYQWIIVPCLLSFAVLGRCRRIFLVSIVSSAALFLAVTLVTFQIMNTVGISVYPSLNDPLAAFRTRITDVFSGDYPELPNLFIPQIYSLIRAYHPLVVALSTLGMFLAPTRLRILACVGTVLGLTSDYFHGVSWIIMNGYPFMYISAGLALVQGPLRLAELVARNSSRRWPQSEARITSRSRVLASVSTVVLLLPCRCGVPTEISSVTTTLLNSGWGFYYILR